MKKCLPVALQYFIFSHLIFCRHNMLYIEMCRNLNTDVIAKDIESYKTLDFHAYTQLWNLCFYLYFYLILAQCCITWQLVFRMQFAVCNSRLNSQLLSRMQFAIQVFLQCVCIPKGLKQSGWGSGDKLPPM